MPASPNPKAFIRLKALRPQNVEIAMTLVETFTDVVASYDTYRKSPSKPAILSMRAASLALRPEQLNPRDLVSSLQRLGRRLGHSS